MHNSTDSRRIGHDILSSTKVADAQLDPAKFRVSIFVKRERKIQTIVGQNAFLGDPLGHPPCHCVEA